MKSFRKTIVTGLAFTLACALLAPQTLEAQTASVWLPKFVCGYQLGDVRLLSDNSPLTTAYESFKPGNYATTINITNTSLQNRTVYSIALVTVPITDPTQPVVTPAISVPVLVPQPLLPLTPSLFAAGVTGTMEINCSNIAAALVANGLPATGQVFEGNLLLFNNAGDSSLQVTAVATFESKDSFREHRVTPVETHGTGEPPGPQIVYVGSGAGGMGLGASIDIETYDPITVDLSTAAGGSLTSIWSGFLEQPEDPAE